MEEIWKDIIGFEKRYQVSNLGRIRSLDRYYKSNSRNGKEYYAKTKGKIMKINSYSNGYKYIGLYKNGKVHNMTIHRLVAQSFIPNPDNLPQVNNKDEDITNNNVNNLEWCTAKYNANYGTRNERCREGNRKQFKSVYQIDTKSGEIIKKWDCMGDACRELNIDISHMIRVCQHKPRNKSAGGYKWEYAD